MWRQRRLEIVLAVTLLSGGQCVQSIALRKDLGQEDEGTYFLGTGIYDITGPAVQIPLVGFVKAGRVGHGIHQRLRARAFIMSEAPAVIIGAAFSERGIHDRGQLGVAQEERRKAFETWGQLDPLRTVCFVSIDYGFGSDLVNMLVVERLNDLLPELAPAGDQNRSAHDHPSRLCHLQNLIISATHTHSAPGGYIQYASYQVESMGLVHETLDTLVEGIAQSIHRAYQNLQPGTLSLAQDTLLGANINRSPSSYLLNPPEERDEYADQGDTDKSVLQLQLQARDGNHLGMINWFAVHPTSMNSSNVLISGDNKGYASYLMEKHYNGADTLPGQGRFVAAFASTNLGDVSPNTGGPRCVDTGLPCDYATSACRGRNELCIAHGPGRNMMESTEMIGRWQYELAVRLMENATTTLTGPVSFRHSFVDMSSLNVTTTAGDLVRTCAAALGYSFAAGTTDGPGAFDFTQGTNSSNPFWSMVSGALSKPSHEQVACQDAKPILLNTGEMKVPYPWDPSIIPIAVARLGQLFILSVPAEFTTMAGRRLRKNIRQLLLQLGIVGPVVVIAGLSNSYTHYVTTYEEYLAQRYEAASTLFGPHTLSAYVQEFRRITADLIRNETSLTETPPHNWGHRQLTITQPAGIDWIGFGFKFGSVSANVEDEYTFGETVTVTFRSANPRHNQRIEDTYLSVDMMSDDGMWVRKYVDGDWCTRFIWQPGAGITGVSYAVVQWIVPPSTTRGIYRICHFGTRRTIFGYIASMMKRRPTGSWFISNILRSYLGTLVLAAVDLVFMLVPSFRRRYEDLEYPILEEFQGCSRSFLVH